MMTVWFFIWGVLVLAMKIGGLQQTHSVARDGLAGIRSHRPRRLGLRAASRQPAFDKIRANYDRARRLRRRRLMAQETAQTWGRGSSAPRQRRAFPSFRWRNGRMLLLLSACSASLFAATLALLLPERLTHLLGHPPSAGNQPDRGPAQGGGADAAAGKNFARPEIQ